MVSAIIKWVIGAMILSATTTISLLIFIWAIDNHLKGVFLKKLIEKLV